MFTIQGVIIKGVNYCLAVSLNRNHVVAVNFLSADMVEPAKESCKSGSVFGMFDSSKIHINKLSELN